MRHRQPLLQNKRRDEQVSWLSKSRHQAVGNEIPYRGFRKDKLNFFRWIRRNRRQRQKRHSQNDALTIFSLADAGLIIMEQTYGYAGMITRKSCDYTVVCRRSQSQGKKPGGGSPPLNAEIKRRSKQGARSEERGAKK